MGGSLEGEMRGGGRKEGACDGVSREWNGRGSL